MSLPIVFLYETRKLNFLKYFTESVEKSGFTLKIINDSALNSDTLFNDFCKIYRHYSDNPYNFELHCFARYFAILTQVEYNTSFIISDSDILLLPSASQLLKNVNELTAEGYFVASEGFGEAGSEQQLSPHFSIWNKALLKSFIEYLFICYTKNIQTEYLKEEYIKRKKLHPTTGISDMTMLYAWVKEFNIPFINSNHIKCSLGIDHNISLLYTVTGKLKSFLNRKKILVKGDKCFIQSTNNELLELSIIHFQGGYKRGMKSFYQKNKLLFLLISLYIYVGRKIKAILR